MITRISTLVVAMVVSGGILFSVGSPALAKSAGVNKGSIGITREAKLIRVIRVKLAKVKVKRISVEKGLIEKGRVNETRARAADPVVEAGRVNETKTKRAAEPVALVREGKAKRAADPVEAVQP